MDKIRLDVYLAWARLAESRERAKSYIRDGLVYVDGQPCRKASATVTDAQTVEIRGETLRYVSRGGKKLEKAIRAFSLDLTGLVCLDVGASTGGFTDRMLQNGATRVYAVDVGVDQLAEPLRADARVISLEQTNVRTLTSLPEPIDFATVDVSFISLKLALPAVKRLLRPGGRAVALIKPQFEVGRSRVGKKGVVRDARDHVRATEDVCRVARELGFACLGLDFSPIRGPEGNIEYLLYLQDLQDGDEPGGIDASDVRRVVAASHDALGETAREDKSRIRSNKTDGKDGENNMKKAISVGEAVIDFTPGGVSQKGMPMYEMNPGGACANVSCVLAKFGLETAFIGKVGRDAFGDFLERQLRANNVDADGLVKDEAISTTLAFVHLSETGDRSFSFVRNPGAETCLRAEELNRSLIDDCAMMHFGAFSLTGEPSRGTVLGLAEDFKKQGKLVSFDPNLRLDVWPSLEDAKETMRRGLRCCNVLKVSEEELLFLTDIPDIERASAFLLDEYDIPIVLATLGKNGVYYKTKDESGHLPTYQEVQTVDTTGAGDCFIGSFLFQASRFGLDGLKGRRLIYALDFANASASLSTTCKGAIPSIPKLEDVEGLMRETLA